MLVSGLQEVAFDSIDQVHIEVNANENWCPPSLSSSQILLDKKNYHVLIGGHFHGSSQNVTGFPAATLLGNVSKINQLDLSFIVCTGDLYLDAENDRSIYQWSLIDQLNAPLFNAPGNHDIYDGRNMYGDFTLGGITHIFLNTELNDGHITGDQLSYLQEAIAGGGETIFIYSHRPIWSEEDASLSSVFKENTASGTNFKVDVLPLLESTGKRFYWFSGSLGGGAPASFFYHDLTGNVTVVNTAIRDLPRDAMLIAHVNDGSVSFETMSLTGQELDALESYDLAFWTQTGQVTEKPFNWRLVPLYVKQMLTHRYFWYGILVTTLCCLLWGWFKRRRKRS